VAVEDLNRCEQVPGINLRRRVHGD
jgi:hypothetical protein